jgi:hypothetical protein
MATSVITPIRSDFPVLTPRNLPTVARLSSEASDTGGSPTLACDPRTETT